MTNDSPGFFPAAAAAVRARQSRLTKPAGSLGRLEALVEQLALVSGELLPTGRPAVALLFASDHPVTRHGVSAFPSDVTAAMLVNFVAGGAASSVLAASLAVPLRVVDVGVARPLPCPASAPHTTFRRDPVASMSAGDLRVEDAMSHEVFAAALAAGRCEVDALPEGTRVVVLGEMGIGNTTVGAAVAASVLQLSVDDVVGRGTGVDDDGLVRKREVVRDALLRVPNASPMEALRRLGGRELAAIVGAAARAAERNMVVLVDGVIVTAAIAALLRAAPALRPAFVFAHRSGDAGHDAMLRALDVKPLLDLGMRLGEGTGALLALSIVDAACALHRNMATFDEAHVPERAG